MKKTRFSPKGRAGATNGRETGNACEIPNRTGKNNIINYGSLEPPLACHGVICLHGLARRGRHCGPRARVAGVWVAPARPGPSASPSPPNRGRPDLGPRGQLGAPRWGRASCGDGAPRPAEHRLTIVPGPHPAAAPSAGLRSPSGAEAGDTRGACGPCGVRLPRRRGGAPPSSVRHLRESAGAGGESSYSGRPSGPAFLPCQMRGGRSQG